MASVFLSYDRADAGKARSIALALEKAGHTVWWDMHVRGGAQFAKAIEAALRESDAVIVLWSKRSIDSAWVRDEASAGRDSGKLLPVTIDGTQPPLGFRQYQSIDFSRWNGRSRAADFQQLVHAIDGLAGDRPSHVADDVPFASPRSFASTRLLAVLLIGVLVIAGAVAAWRYTSRSSVPLVAVVAADSSAASTALARDLFVKLGRLGSGATQSMDVTLDDRQIRPDLRLEVSSASEGQRVQVSAAMLDRDRRLLWSRDFQGSQAERADLKQQLALSAASVLQCASEATGKGNRLDSQTLKIYLNGCAILAGATVSDVDPRSLVRIFRQVAVRAPTFDGSWAKLLSSESFVIGNEFLPADSPESGQLRRDIATVRKRGLDPPELYWAEFILLPSNAFPETSAVVEQGIARHPDSPVTLSAYSSFLVQVGRMKEAVASLKRAVQLDPLSPSLLGDYINVLGWAGQLDTARQQLELAERLWPDTSSLRDSRWRFGLRFGDPQDALRITRANPEYGDFEYFLEARIAPNPANIDRALAEATAQYGRDPRAIGYLVQVLAEFGREEEIYRLVQQRNRTDAALFTDAFFRPAFRRFRSDSRFIAVAKQFGLLAYWQKSGKWPDFCFEPDLPYNCKAEAAKLATRAG